MQVPHYWFISDPQGCIVAWRHTGPEETTLALFEAFLFDSLRVNPLGFPRAVSRDGLNEEYTAHVLGTDVTISYVLVRPPRRRTVIITAVTVGDP